MEMDSLIVEADDDYPELPDSQPMFTDTELIGYKSDQNNSQANSNQQETQNNYDDNTDQNNCQANSNQQETQNNYDNNTDNKDNDPEESDDKSRTTCIHCIFDKDIDKRNYYFGNLLIGELQFLPPCMRSEAYIAILQYVDKLKNKHRT